MLILRLFVAALCATSETAVFQIDERTGEVKETSMALDANCTVLSAQQPSLSCCPCVAAPSAVPKDSTGNELFAPANVQGCEAYTAAGLFCVVKRGSCSFGQKADAAEQAGCASLLIVNNDDSADIPPPALGDSVVNIPGSLK